MGGVENTLQCENIILKARAVAGLHAVRGSAGKSVPNSTCTINLHCSRSEHSIAAFSIQIVKNPHFFGIEKLYHKMSVTLLYLSPRWL